MIWTELLRKLIPRSTLPSQLSAMNELARAPFTPRPLTTAEYRLARWMLENGGSDARAFLPQVDRATVVGRCGCGCASIDFAIDGMAPPSVPMRPVADFLFGDGDDLCGIFIYAQEGVLGGIEVFGHGNHTPTTLPTPEELRPA